MAQKVLTILVDDIDNGDASETIQFGLDGVEYEIDLNDKHAGELRKAIGKFAGHGRRIAKGKRKRAAAAARTSSPLPPVAPPLPTNGTNGSNGTVNGAHSAREIRDWARTNNIDVPAKGRVPNAITEQFEAAH